MSPPASKTILPPGLYPLGKRSDPAGSALLSGSQLTGSRTGSRRSDPDEALSTVGEQSLGHDGSRNDEIPIGQSQETNSSARLQGWLSNAILPRLQRGAAPARRGSEENSGRAFRHASIGIGKLYVPRRAVPTERSTPANPPFPPSSSPSTPAALTAAQVLPLETQYLGPWLPHGTGSSLAAPRLLPPSHQRSRNLSASSSSSPALGLLVIRAHADSGCSGSLTNNGGALVNLRPCNERFKAADGLEYKASHIGDMPVVAKDSTGRHRRLVFRNVRLVPLDSTSRFCPCDSSGESSVSTLASPTSMRWSYARPRATCAYPSPLPPRYLW